MKGAMRITEPGVFWTVARALGKLCKRKMISSPSPRRHYVPINPGTPMPHVPHHLKLLKTQSFGTLVTCDYCNILLPLTTLRNHEKWQTGLGFLGAKGYTYTVTTDLPNAQGPVAMGNKGARTSSRVRRRSRSCRNRNMPLMSTGHNWRPAEANGT